MQTKSLLKELRAPEGSENFDFNTNSDMCASPDQNFLSFGRTEVTIMKIPEFKVIKSFKHGGKGARSSNMTNDVYISGDYTGRISIYKLHSIQEEPTEITSHTS